MDALFDAALGDEACFEELEVAAEHSVGNMAEGDGHVEECFGRERGGQWPIVVDTIVRPAVAEHVVETGMVLVPKGHGVFFEIVLIVLAQLLKAGPAHVD